MRQRFIIFVSLIALAVSIFSSFASTAEAAVHVNGYFRKDGTYVQPYYRSDPDSSPYNNYSYPGNTNPYTGVTTGGNPNTYLDDYLKHSNTPSYTVPSPIHTYTTPTPTCPLFSTYDSYSSSCKCNAGYIVSGTSCINADIYCHGKAGYGSHYDTSTSNCVCDTGYVIDSSGKCAYGPLVCHSKYGLFSSYSSSDNTCSCDSGYRFNANRDTCISNNDWCEQQFGYGTEYNSSSNNCVCKKNYQLSSSGLSCQQVPPKSALPTYSCDAFGEHAEILLGTDKCICSSGFIWSGDKTKCVAISTPQISVSTPTTNHCDNGKEFSNILNKCICPVWYEEDASGACVSENQLCKQRFGSSFFSPDKGQCYCDTGYTFDSATQKCINADAPFNGSLASKNDLLKCAVVGNAKNHLYYLRGNKLIKQMAIIGKICFMDENKAKKAGYKKAK